MPKKCRWQDLIYLCQPTSARSLGSSPTFCNPTVAGWSHALIPPMTSHCSAQPAHCWSHWCHCWCRAPSSWCLGLTAPPPLPIWSEASSQQLADHFSTDRFCHQLRCQSWMTGPMEDLKLMLANCGQDQLEGGGALCWQRL